MERIKNFVRQTALTWAEAQKQDTNSQSGFLLRYIEKANKLRDAQEEALKVYMWLKVVGQNETLYEIIEKNYNSEFGEGIIAFSKDLAEELNSAKFSAFINKASMPQLKEFFENFFGGYTKTPNYLFSLPMGAGKTFVMAAIIYLDMYFTLTQNNDNFAQNFLVFAPSGLKSSVIPSLRTIQRFDPSWILPPDIAEKIQAELKFVILDAPKTEKKSNKIENPNARKVMECLRSANPRGHVFITNAEKVVLSKVPDTVEQLRLLNLTNDETSKKENELRFMLARVPHLAILIDEVHHVQKEENKLKVVVNNQLNAGNLRYIVGFTGTPYAPRKLIHDALTLRLDQIPTTVYHYELKNGVKNFLKQPRIKQFSTGTREIVRSGLEDFYDQLYEVRYRDGRLPKIAIYCSTIERLETEILPVVVEFYNEKGLNTDEILKYYGNSSVKNDKGVAYKVSKNAEVEFRKLDTTMSKKRVILLCQIGKEGWDCQSLAGVILSGEGDSPRNMVLQTACRCLRVVEDASTEFGLIFMNNSNYLHLEEELSSSHKTQIEDFIKGKSQEKILQRIDRRKHLGLPKLEFNQLEIEYLTEKEFTTPDTSEFLNGLLKDLEEREPIYYSSSVVISKEGLELHDSVQSEEVLSAEQTEYYPKEKFVVDILKASYGLISREQISKNQDQLEKIWRIITNGSRLIEEFNKSSILGAICASFLPQKKVTTRELVNTKSVEWLVADINKIPVNPVAMYPSDQGLLKSIVEFDNKELTIEPNMSSEIKILEETKQKFSHNKVLVDEINNQIASLSESQLPIQNRDKSFQYIPYEFTDSRFEKEILEKVFMSSAFKKNALEVYYNGNRFISNFKIKIYKKQSGNWRLIQDQYTPDFLIIKRDKTKKVVLKVLIIETKGAHLASSYTNIKDFMETTFVELNKEKYGYLYIEDGRDSKYYTERITRKIDEVFNLNK